MITLQEQIKKANEAYRKGNAIISDFEYDQLLEKLKEENPNDPLLNKVGIEPTNKKETLPLTMGSLNKVKTIEEIKKWLSNACNNIIDDSTRFCVTPKFDGISLLVDEKTKKAWTRGNGIIGENCTDKYNLISNKLFFTNIFNYSWGEAIIPKSIFKEKYSKDFANARNLVAGLFNSKTVSEKLKDVYYIKYGGILYDQSYECTKSNVISTLNNNLQKTLTPLKQCPYYIITLKEINNENKLISIFNDFKNSLDFDIDGIVIELEDMQQQHILGREENNNPKYARAFKHSSFIPSIQTEVLNIEWNISKQGLLKPVLIINPIKLNGATISRVTGNNARFLKDNNINNGSVVKIIRSGMVIPKVIEVIKKVPFEDPIIKDSSLMWNETETDLIVVNKTDEQEIKKITSFFQILEADNISIGTITQLYNAGYKTLIDILNIPIHIESEYSKLMNIEGISEKKIDILVSTIKNILKGKGLSTIWHALGIFKHLGSKKLILLEDFYIEHKTPTIEEIIKRPGFSETLAKEFCINYDECIKTMHSLPGISGITFKKVEPPIIQSGIYSGKIFVFTGFRNKEWETIIENNGGIISNSINKNTSYLIMKNKGSGSSKEQKALSLNIPILDINEFNDKFLKL